jgi:2-keto-3-deoxy-L-fuconate dehydrogenase
MKTGSGEKAAMAGRLQGKQCFVTAAGQGMGRAAAIAMAAEGGTVVATDRDAAKLDSLRDIPGIRTAALDVLDDAAVARAVQAAGRIDVLFSCAGFVHQNTLLTCTDDDWDFAMALNVRAMWKLIAAAMPGMLAQGGGSIVLMGSACSSLKGVSNRFAYGTSKGAVLGLMKSVATEYVGQGIRCNTICPGTVETPSLHERVAANAAAAGGKDAAMAAFVARQPMGRLASAEEIAQLVVYLAADESRFVTGQGIVVDGGWTL